MTRPIPTLLLTLALAACGGASPATSTPTATPATATPATATPTTAGVPSLHQGVLQPGRYTTTSFQPKLTMTLGEGWEALFQDDEDEIAFERAGPAFFAITRVSQVVDPTTGRAVAAPDDLAAWLVRHPALDADQPQPATVAGVTGTSLEAAVKSVSQMDTFAYPTGNMHFTAGERVRFYVLPFDGPDLVAVFSTAPTGFDAVAADVKTVLESLEVAAPPG